MNMKGTMKLKNIRALFMWMMCLILAGSGVLLMPGRAEAMIERSFSDPIDLGEPIQAVSVFDSAFGKEDGHDAVYMTVSGSPGVFNVVDLQTRELLRSFPMEGVHDAWTHLALEDGTIYIGTGAQGKLFRYSPETKQLEDLGSFSGQRQLYGLSADEHGNIYGGTYPGGKVFKYDPVAKQFTDYGQLSAGREYVRSTAYYDGHLYAGVGTAGGIIKLNVETGEKTELPLPEGYESVGTIGSLDAAGQYLFASLGGTLAVYDMANEEWSGQFFPNYRGLRLIQGPEGSNKVYFIQNGKLIEVDLTTLESRDTGVSYGTYIRNSAWVEADDPDLPGLSLVTANFSGGVVYMNLETKVTKGVALPVEGQPVPIRVMEKGPDGAIYMSGYPGGTGSKYDPVSGETTSFGMGQAEGMAYIGNKLYLGVYPGAVIYEMDVSQPGQLKEVFRIEGEDRPFIMTAGGGKLYIGTIPDYGELGGALTIYDPETGEHQIFYDVIYNQSIVGIAYRDGKLYGSTSVDGGEGINPTEKEAKMFVWDLETNEKTIEFVPNLPGAVTVPDMISGLTFGPDGLLWGAADGIIFAMDPDTLEIVKSKVIYPEVSYYGKWQPVYAKWGQDGLLYTTLAGQLTVIDPVTLEHARLGTTAVMTLGDDGHIYYRGDSTHLMKIEVSEGVTIPEANIPVPLPNLDFEEPVTDGSIPGWSRLHQSGSASYEVTDERSSSGLHSLKLVDQSQTETIAVQSEPFEVKPGVEYKASADVFLEEGRSIFSIYFFNSAGQEIANQTVYIDSGRGVWQQAEVRATAPEEAAYARIRPWISQYWMGKVFYDNIKVSYVLESEMVDLAFIRDLLEQYETSGQISRPTYVQLSNRLQQASKHLEHGRISQAVKHMHDFLEDLSNPGLSRRNDSEAARILAICAHHFIQANE